MAATGGGGESILVIDDDAAIGRVLVALLRQRGLDARWVASAEEGLKELAARPVDVVLSDVRMPGMDGMGLLDEVSRCYPEVPVVLLTAHGSVALAVEAMKRGAADFVQKPFEREEVLHAVDRAIARSTKARADVPGHAWPARPAGGAAIQGMIGDSDAMRAVFATVRKVAKTTATVLICGETGTGKELVARALHEESPRSSQPFVRVHCAALPETLLESELFGYEKGAFTGATQRKPGRIELAHGGTLLLDEIGDISAAVQVKLLRVLQERELERVGGTQTVRVDVRFVVATHRDLEAMVRAGTFREDLFYRISVVPIVVPPLRERPGDCERLVRHFATTFGGATIDAEAVRRLVLHPWPGNVRQLQNFVERVVVLADGPTVTLADVDRALAGAPRARPDVPMASSPSAAGAAAQPGASLDARRRETEKDALLHALAQAGNNRTRAARLLEVSRRTLYNKLHEHGLE
jgi:DNA-binding NtrC family response regulator